MNDDPDRHLDALFAAARGETRDTSRVEFGFETRLAARLREEAGASLFAWAWRLCPFFAALALAVGWWNHTSGRAQAAAQLIAEAANPGDERVLLARITGEER